MSKILKLVDSCGGCPHYGYYSGGQSECRLVDEIVVNKALVAPFCPLADFPSRLLADMDATIRLLRAPNTYGFVLALLSHIATKLKRELSTGGVIDIALKNGTSIFLRHDAVIEVLVDSWAIIFVEGRRQKFKLHPDSQPPQLYKQVTVKGEEGE